MRRRLRSPQVGEKGDGVVASREIGVVEKLDETADPPGPDLRVYLAAGTSGVDGRVDLGGLKGNRGTQQYAIPGSVDTGRYRRVVIWCRAFSVNFGEAVLT